MDLSILIIFVCKSIINVIKMVIRSFRVLNISRILFIFYRNSLKSQSCDTEKRLNKDRSLRYQFSYFISKSKIILYLKNTFNCAQVTRRILKHSMTSRQLWSRYI